MKRARAVSHGQERPGVVRPEFRPQPAIPPVAIIVSTYNEPVTDALLVGAVEAFEAAGGDGHALSIIPASGSFELPLLALTAAATGRYAGVVALGCIIKGQTIHDRVIAQTIADGLMHASLQTGLPIGLGVITANSPKQARERAGGRKGNKGVEAMNAVIASVRAIRSIEDSTTIESPIEAVDERGVAMGSRKAGR